MSYSALIRISSRHSRALAWLEHMIMAALVGACAYAILVYVFHTDPEKTQYGELMYYFGSLYGFARGRKSK